jgi:DNA polymerase III alpha subunit
MTYAALHNHSHYSLLDSTMSSSSTPRANTA